MDKELLKRKHVESLVFIVLEALDILHLAKALHLSPDKSRIIRIFNHHPETILMVVRKILENKLVWKVLSKNPAFTKKHKVKKFRKELTSLME